MGAKVGQIVMVSQEDAHAFTEPVLLDSARRHGCLPGDEEVRGQAHFIPLADAEFTQPRNSAGRLCSHSIAEDAGSCSGKIAGGESWTRRSQLRRNGDL